MEREHQKEKQKLLKDKDAGRSSVHTLHSEFTRPDFDAAKSQLTKANQTKIKMENLARELQKVCHVVSPNLTTLTEVPAQGQQAVKGE
jgi:translation initiation factor 2B subunit (eIF-2B alpha/beta/delta family)